MGSKYNTLTRYLEAAQGDSLQMSFYEVEEIVGELPNSAKKHRAWWSNNHTNTSARNGWLAAGWRTSRVDMEAQELLFVRESSKTKVTSGPEEREKHNSPYRRSFEHRSSNPSMTEIAKSAGGADNLIRVIQTIEEYIHGEIVETELGRRLRSLWPRTM